MDKKDNDASGERDYVRIPDFFIVKYNLITREEYEKKAPLYVSRNTANRTAGRKSDVEGFSFDWSDLEKEEDFDPLLVKILFYLDKKIDKVISRQEEILKKFVSEDAPQEKFEYGECIDISGSGVNMLTAGKLDEDALLELTLEPPGNPPIQVVALGKPARVRPASAKEANGFEASVTFTAIHEDDRDDLIKYIFQRQREIISSRKRSER